MTQDEADKIARIIGTAYSGWDGYVRGLCRRLNSAGLGYEFKLTGKEIKVPADWSDDPEDMAEAVEVVATPCAQMAAGE